MTKAHQALTLLQIARAAPALLTSYSSLGARLLFFQPDAHGFSRDTEDALKPSQRTALLISIEDLFFFGIGITFRLWIFTTTTISVVTPIALFSLRSMPIAYNVFASTVTTFKGDSDHRFRLSTIPLYFSTTQRAALPGFDLICDGVSHRRDQRRRDFHLVNLLQVLLDLAGGHTSCVQREYLVVEALEAGLAFRDDLRLEGGVAVARHF